MLRHGSEVMMGYEHLKEEEEEERKNSLFLSQMKYGESGLDTGRHPSTNDYNASSSGQDRRRERVLSSSDSNSL